MMKRRSDDELYRRACEFVCRTGRVSVSAIQRKFDVGFYTAYGWIERMQADGIIAIAKDPLH